MTNFQVGDFVRVTDDRYPNCAVEGEVLEPEYPNDVITVSSIWNKVSHFNLNYVEVTVLARVEPATIGSVHEQNGRVFVKFREVDSGYNWISDLCINRTWEDIND